MAGVGTKTYAYNAIGNLTSKSDVGGYTYGSGGIRPHGVTQAGANTYAYDANGNMTTGAGRTLTWSSANLATQISQSAASSTFFYGPDGARWKHVKLVGAQTTTTRYLGGLYEESVAAGVTEKKHYIFAGDERIAIYATKTSGTSSLKYLHQDHLGSTDAVSDASGAVIERLSYDPHGKRRNANWTDAGGLLASVSTDRGFTDHEHLDELGLIHMNGRVYDPTLGRFLSADPTVQFPEASQSLNRYSYVLNNPLSLTDPTGLFSIGSIFKSIGHAFKRAFRWISKNWRTIAAVAVNFIPIPGVPQALMTSLQGFASGLIASRGDFRAGLIGAASAGWGYRIGPVKSFNTFAAQALGSAVASKLSGGRFMDGLRVGGIIGFSQWSLFQVQQAVRENAGGVLQVVGVSPGGEGASVIGPPQGTGTLSVGGVGPLDIDAHALRVGGKTFDAAIQPHVSTFADVMETGLSIVSGRSVISEQLADVIASSSYTNIVGHSQGALQVAQAMKLLGRDSLQGVNVRILGGAVSESYASQFAALTGVQSFEYTANFFDPISTFVGGGGFRNLLKFAAAVPGAATLPLSSINQHGYRCNPQPAPCY